MTDFLPANGYSDGDVDTNRTSNPTLESLVGERYSRRQAMFGGIGALTHCNARNPLACRLRRERWRRRRQYCAGRFSRCRCHQ
jgi:hypothetical protein